MRFNFLPIIGSLQQQRRKPAVIVHALMQSLNDVAAGVWPTAAHPSVWGAPCQWISAATTRTAGPHPTWTLML